MAHGINPYTFGPFSAPGPFTNEMSPRWVFSPAPYGPLWMQIAHAIVGVSGNHPDGGRSSPAVACVGRRAPGAWTLPSIARRIGGRTELGLWLGVASPLTLVLGVGGGHNDLLMAGLLVAGLAVVCQGSWTALALGSAILGTASVVKTPAVAGFAFAVPIWLHVRRPHRRGLPPVRKIVSSAAVVGAVGIATMTIVTVGSGLGWPGCTRSAPISRWSIGFPCRRPSQSCQPVPRGGGGDDLDASMQLHQITWERPHRGRAGGVVVRGASFCSIDLPVIGLAAAASLVPAVQPWYYCWALVLAGLVVTRRWVWIVLMTTIVSSVIMIRPNGRASRWIPP